MQLAVETAAELGLALRAVRKDSRVRLDDLAQTVGLSKQTTANAEQGRAKIETVLALCKELGIEITVEVPDSAHSLFEKLKAKAEHGVAASDEDDFGR